jgi:hypothetical protein
MTTPESTVLDTPDGIRYFHLLALRGALKLEMRGLRRSGGRSVAEVVRNMYKLRPRCKREVALAKLEEEIAALLAKKRGGAGRCT